MEGYDFYSKWFIRIGLAVGLHDSSKITCAQFFIEQNIVCLDVVVNVQTSDALLDRLLFHLTDYVNQKVSESEL